MRMTLEDARIVRHVFNDWNIRPEHMNTLARELVAEADRTINRHLPVPSEPYIRWKYKHDVFWIYTMRGFQNAQRSGEWIGYWWHGKVVKHELPSGMARLPQR